MCTPYIESHKWLPWQRPLGVGYRQYLHSVDDHSNPLHNQLPSQYRPHKASYSKLRPKIGCHGNVPQHLWTPIQHMIPTAHPTLQPKRHPYRFSRLCTDDRRVSLYFTVQFSPKNLPLPMGDLDPHLIHGSLGPPKSSTQTAARSVQPFL